MKALITIFLLSACVAAQELPVAPSSAIQHTADRRFFSFVALTSAANAADAYTTSAYVGHTSSCDIEKWSPWLYGRKPADARVVSVIATETVGVSVFSYFLKRRHSRLWYLPLAVNGSAHAWGAIHNFQQCR